MGHKSKPRDSCGGVRKCGGNLLVSRADGVEQDDSMVRRNMKAVSEIVSSLTAAVALRRGR